MSEVDARRQILDAFCGRVQSAFKALLLAETRHTLGTDSVDMLGDDILISRSLGLSIEFEPIPVAELKGSAAAHPSFLTEVFHGKLVQYWLELHDLLFDHYLELHLSGVIKIREIGIQEVRVDFSDDRSLESQIRESLLEDFRFRKHSDRLRLLARLLKAADEQQVSLCRWHVHFRNALQHHQGVLRNFVFREMGRHSVAVLDDKGASRTLEEGDKIAISIPEFDRFRRALLLVAQQWRN